MGEHCRQLQEDCRTIGDPDSQWSFDRTIAAIAAAAAANSFMEIGPHSQTYLLDCGSSLIRVNSNEQAPVTSSSFLFTMAVASLPTSIYICLTLLQGPAQGFIQILSVQIGIGHLAVWLSSQILPTVCMLCMFQPRTMHKGNFQCYELRLCATEEGQWLWNASCDCWSLVNKTFLCETSLICFKLHVLNRTQCHCSRRRSAAAAIKLV